MLLFRISHSLLQTWSPGMYIPLSLTHFTELHLCCPEWHRPSSKNWKKGTLEGAKPLPQKEKSLKSTTNFCSLGSPMKCTCHLHVTSRRDSSATALGRFLPVSQFPWSGAAYFQREVSRSCVLCFSELEEPISSITSAILPSHMN